MSAEGLIEALSSTEVDLSVFAGLADEEDDDGDSSEVKAATKFLSSDDDSANKKSTKGSNTEHRVFGKDKYGHYKNQANYIKLRNKINAQESAHQAMFDNINTKLMDSSFLEQAVQASWSEVSLAEGDDAAASGDAGADDVPAAPAEEAKSGEETPA